MTTQGETAKSPKVRDPLQLRGPEDENLHDPLAHAHPLPPKRQSVVEETPAIIPTSADARERFTQSELNRPIAEIGTKKKDVKTPLSGHTTQSLPGANGTGDTRSKDRSGKQTSGLQSQTSLRTRSQTTKAGLQYQNLPGQVGGPVQTANSKGQPMHPVPPQVQRKITSPND